MKTRNILQNRKLLNIVTGVLIVLSIVWYARPRSFTDIMPGFDPSQVTVCEADYFISGVVDTEPMHHYQMRSFEPDTEDYEALLALLDSTTYRRQFTNLFTGGTTHAYSIHLNPYASVYFHQGNKRYEFSLFGQDVPVGPTGDRYDYSPWGGRDFQRRAIEFIGTHGVLIEEN